MTRPDLGTKRICSGCSLKFYDLHKTPIVCPTCQTVLVLPKPSPARPRRPLEAQPVDDHRIASPAVAAAVIPADDADGDADGDEEADVGVPVLEDLDDDDEAPPADGRRSGEEP